MYYYVAIKVERILYCLQVYGVPVYNDEYNDEQKLKSVFYHVALSVLCCLLCSAAIVHLP